MPKFLHRHTPFIFVQAYRHPQIKSRHAERAGAICHGALHYTNTRDPWEARPASACAGHTAASGIAAMRERSAAGATGRAPARPTARRSLRTWGGAAAGCRQGAQSVDTSSLPALEAADGAPCQRAGVRSTRAPRSLLLRRLLPHCTSSDARTKVLRTVRACYSSTGMQSALRPAIAGLVLLCMHHSASSTVFSMATGTHWAVAGGQPSALRLRGGGDAAHAAKAAGEPGHTTGAAGPRLRCNAQQEH
jgi:hypothetical protein